jgi:hypothetical protein
MELGVPIFQGRIDKTLFQATMTAEDAGSLLLTERMTA